MKKNRSIASLKRRRPTLPPREYILIVCEGSKTEPNYFNFIVNKLNLRTVEFEILGLGTVPITLIDRAKKEKESREQSNSPFKTNFDAVYCVFDVEAPTPHTSFDQAIDKAKGNNIEVIVSNPCFEFWYILHFHKTSKVFNKNTQVIKELRKHLPEYQKKSTTFLTDTFYSKTDYAISNSKAIIKGKRCNEYNYKESNPVTYVHLLIEKLKYIANLPQKIC